jgi:hypothetical protein
MRDAVRNGPNVWPGATHIEESNGKKINLNPNEEKSRAVIAKTLLTPFEASSQAAVYEVRRQNSYFIQTENCASSFKNGRYNAS